MEYGCRVIDEHSTIAICNSAEILRIDQAVFFFFPLFPALPVLAPVMFRNQYDNDITTWSPQGRIHQIEYAMEAVKQGSCAVGLKSKQYAVIVALKRSSSELSAHQRKIFKLDDHVGIAISGLTSDARVLSKFMRNECLNSRYVFEAPLPVSRLISSVGDKTQVCTQRAGRRPYGVGLLVAGFDESGTHIYQTCPSSNYYDCKAMSIGARSQSAKTYLERHFEEFTDADKDTLIRHGLTALRDSLPSNTKLSQKNCSVGIVGFDTAFTILEEDALSPYLSVLDEASSSSSGRGGAGSGNAAAMVTDEPAAGAGEPEVTPAEAMPSADDSQPPQSEAMETDH
ncbi:20S proteasome alpha6 subunit [Capsaspora owczarzaki ATCC 30864]|uniref:20S proteasome alpha6 subunit n=1 Tax=Capsaspora owczarzaki (strain ATCC 30864) TaxID=595528 RepID=A0A0D2WYS1_CAPO3|nr:20S proteasome alpha6 subunit [Capsaspora owczarzaki ATCC 30864]KJE98188.1 20S proteasome alpha6 subunit [Capsaspora owczarzaki ATCC 30864]|eukprot:XP_004342791.2 20S proteasome alpha6 subunit [Capsaspora owczarzaki ATCC 30864]